MGGFNPAWFLALFFAAVFLVITAASLSPGKRLALRIVAALSFAVFVGGMIWDFFVAPNSVKDSSVNIMQTNPYQSPNVLGDNNQFTFNSEEQRDMVERVTSLEGKDTIVLSCEPIPQTVIIAINDVGGSQVVSPDHYRVEGNKVQLLGEAVTRAWEALTGLHGDVTVWYKTQKAGCKEKG